MIEYDINQIAPEGEVEPPEENSGSIAEYALILAALLSAVWYETRTSVLAAYKIGAVDESIFQRLRQSATTAARDESIFQRLRQSATTAARVASDKLERLFTGEAIRNTKRWIANIKKALKIDVGTILRPEDAGDLVRLFVQKNTGLIKSLSDDAVKIVEQAVYDAHLQKRSAAELQKSLQAKITGLKDGRAKLIADDQLSKLNGQLNMMRIQQAGGKEYKWDYQKGIPRKTSRAHHVARHKQIFKIGEPSGDEPGQAIGCKCRARMISWGRNGN